VNPARLLLLDAQRLLQSRGCPIVAASVGSLVSAWREGRDERIKLLKSVTNEALVSLDL
jgi:hypothetical protein